MSSAMVGTIPQESNPAPARKRRRRLAIASSIVLLIAFVAALGGWEYLNYRSNFGVVVPGKIYRSAEISRFIIRGKLQQNGIGVIVFLSHDAPEDVDLQAEKQVAQQLGVAFLNFPMNGDGVADPAEYTKALTAICEANQAGKRVLIHCHSGAQRTGGVVAIYRMLVEGKTPESALAEMRYYGHDPRKNLTLVPFLNEHVGEWAAALAQRGLIQRAPDPLPKLTP